ncbi:MAG: S8 family serine peptidase, partial [Spirochaetes bacterium]|nr:S8 family serine peptidase [Spirochaetota bacterium]
MIRRYSIIFFVIILAFFSYADSSYTQTRNKSVKIRNNIRKQKFYLKRIKRNVNIIGDEVIIKYKDEKKAEQMIKRKKFEKIRGIKRLKYNKIRIPKTRKIEDVITELKKEKDILKAEPNYIIKKSGQTIQDEYYSSQWGLKKIEWEKCLDISQNAQTVRIAVIDTGVDLNHNDLKNNLLSGYNFVHNNANPYDDNGHGTMVAGVIGAELNTIGIAGINPNVKILPVKVLDHEGYGTYFDLIQGIDYAVGQGVKVINLSLGGEAYSEILKDTIDDAVNHGCVIISASGDENNNLPLYPSGYENVICAVDLNEEDKINYDANFGSFIDYGAPGIGIYSTFINNSYKYATGSSMATAFLSGMVSLLLANQPALSKDEITEVLNSSSDYVPEYKLKSDLKIRRIKINKILYSLFNSLLIMKRISPFTRSYMFTNRINSRFNASLTHICIFSNARFVIVKLIV